MANRKILIFLVILAMGLVIAGCESMKRSRPIMPVKDYEKMIVGRLDADYVGTNNCLRACHAHDKLRKDFEASTMGAQMSSQSGMPIVDCESCHGPGSLAIAGLTPRKVKEAEKQGKTVTCNYKTLIDIKKLPAGARSLICLKCHTSNATFNLHYWSSSPHAMHGVTCIDCHNIHHGPDLIVSPRDTAKMCFRCHQDVKAEFHMVSHHPVPEQKIFCTDCHDPHGSMSDYLLKKDSVKATCTQCHAEKEGPFAFEHAELTSNCLNCHNQHGSVNPYLLKLRLPFLCLQCHTGHQRVAGGDTAEIKGAIYTRCTDCHSQVHGTDLPTFDTTNPGRFTR